MPVNETFHGFIETTTDTLLIFEACRRGILSKITRRLQECERGAVRSGTVFVFDERESGIKRWTDGFVWSPSRILGNFLIYRELDSREYKRRNTKEEQETEMVVVDRNRERALVGSLTTSYNFKKGGLIKKTMSIVINGSPQHLISYYTKEDVLSHRLVTPSSIPELACLEISPELVLRQSFRIPPSLDHGHKSSCSFRNITYCRPVQQSRGDPSSELPETRRKSSRKSLDNTCATDACYAGTTRPSLSATDNIMVRYTDLGTHPLAASSIDILQQQFSHTEYSLPNDRRPSMFVSSWPLQQASLAIFSKPTIGYSTGTTTSNHLGMQASLTTTTTHYLPSSYPSG